MVYDIGARLLGAALELQMDHAIVPPSARGVELTIDGLLFNYVVTSYLKPTAACSSFQRGFIFTPVKVIETP